MKLKDVLKLDLKEQTEYFWFISVAKEKREFRRLKKYKTENLEEFKYMDVDYIKRLFFTSEVDSIIEIITIMFKVKRKKVLNLNIKVVIGLIKFIQNQIESILKEEDKLERFSDPKIQMALAMSKADIMNQFGIANAIDSLCNGDKSKWDYFKNLAYREVSFMLTFNTVGNSVNKRFQKNYNDMLKLENR